MPLPSNSICPKCSTPIAEGAPQGLCPKCVLLGVATAAKPRGKEGHAPAPHEIAPHFPELEVLELIGVGGMGAVYKARQTKLGRLVALKVLSSALADDTEFLERFDREARVLGRLNHPGIVTVFDSGMAGPCAYLLMEFVDGVNLRQAMQSGGFTPGEALAVTQEICSALEYAHGQGILHRDIKPENILIDGTGRVKIADFGIAKLVGDQGPDHATLTIKGAILGSMSYMAPEQFDAPGDVDQRADIYSLGVVLYELLTGELPRGRFGPPSDKSAVDARIDEIVMRTLEREREARFQNVHQMKTQMDAATQPGIAPAPASGPAPERKTARFANMAPICTLLSLLASCLFIPFLITTLKKELDDRRVYGDDYFFLALLLLLIVTMAGLGVMFAKRALVQIREAGEKTPGFTRAFTAVATWPVLIGLLMTGLSVPVFRSSSLRSLLLGALLLAGASLAVVMLRSIYRWAKNAEPATPPGKAALRFTLVAFVAIFCSFLHLRAEAVFEKRTTWSLYLGPGDTVNVRVVRVDTRSNEIPLNIKGTIKAPSYADLQTRVTIISDPPDNDGMQKLWMVYNGPGGTTYENSVTLTDHWKFLPKPRSGALDGKKDRIAIATRQNWFGFDVETLYLETVTSTTGDLSPKQP